MTKAKRKYLLWDARACGAVGTDGADCLACCNSDKEARSWCGEFGAMACYSYQMSADGKEAVDEHWEWDYRS